MKQKKSKLNKEGRKTYKVSEHVGSKRTVQQLVKWCADNKMSVNDVYMNNPYVSYDHIETDEEFEKRKARDEKNLVAHKAYIKKRYKELFKEE